MGPQWDPREGVAPWPEMPVGVLCVKGIDYCIIDVFQVDPIKTATLEGTKQ